jgi:hypothetical protein
MPENSDAPTEAHNRSLVAATLAAAIIQVRGKATPTDVKEAYDDAYWTTFPQPKHSRYEAWRKSRGL